MGVNAETSASPQTFADRADQADPYVEAGRLRDELAQTQRMLADAQVAQATLIERRVVLRHLLHDGFVPTPNCLFQRRGSADAPRARSLLF